MIVVMLICAVAAAACRRCCPPHFFPRERYNEQYVYIYVRRSNVRLRQRFCDSRLGKDIIITDWMIMQLE